MLWAKRFTERLKFRVTDSAVQTCTFDTTCGVLNALIARRNYQAVHHDRALPSST
jgi:hypothetical protein